VTAPVVHLELHTPDLTGARDFLRAVVGWRAASSGSTDGSVTAPVPYVSVDVGLSGGLVQCGTRTAMWLPYVEVLDVDTATERALGRGAAAVLAPRTGPYGRRSVVRSPVAGDLAFWQAS
jgi:predicted enzyme related to lactoylglutathione lyase